MGDAQGLSRRQKSWITITVVAFWILLTAGVLLFGVGAVYQVAVGAEPTMAGLLIMSLVGWVMHSMAAMIYFTTMPGLGGEAT